jgi:hypothetical protein
MAGEKQLFVGLTKFQFYTILVCFLILMFSGVSIYQASRQKDLKAEQKRVARYLCDMTNGAWRARGIIIDGLTVAAIKQVHQELTSDKTRRPELVEQDMRFLDTFNEYHAQLQAELAYKDPNCSK